MLNINISATAAFDNATEKFVDLPSVQLPPLEHSLMAIAKWEAKYQVPFLNNIKALTQPKHFDKFLYYVSCMSTKGEIPMEVLRRLNAENLTSISEYISDPHSATLPKGGGKGSNKPPTAERIYGSMVSYRIPHEYSRWHLNNLLRLIDICAENSEDPSKRSTPDYSAQAAFYEQNERLRRNGLSL